MNILRAIVRRSLGLAILALLSLALLAPPTEARTRYCFPNGSLCQWVDRGERSVEFRWQTFHHRGRYELCVGTKDEPATCVTRRLRQVLDNVYRDTVGFKSNFPHRDSGRYYVSWLKDGEAVGRTLSFRHERQ